MTQTHKRILNLTMTAVFTALIAVCSWITVPIPVIPFTMQLFAVFTALCILGGKYGTLSVVLYIALGVVGVPVFAGFRSGIGVLLGATGGYIVGFFVLALVYWLITARRKVSIRTQIIALVAGQFSCYAFGTAWYLFAYTEKTGLAGIGSALMMCVVPYILPDLVKLGLAVTVSRLIAKRTRFDPAAATRKEV